MTALACATVISRLTPFDVTSSQDLVEKLSLLEEHYDIFLSYSHCNEEQAKEIMKELRTYQPDINIFIDTAELKVGATWQQALYEALGNNTNYANHGFIFCPFDYFTWKYYVIYTERESVLYHGIKTPRSVLKNKAVGRVF